MTKANARTAQLLAHPGFHDLGNDEAFRADSRWFADHPDRQFHGRRMYPEEMRWSGLSADDMATTRMLICRAKPGQEVEGDPQHLRLPLRLTNVSADYELPDDEVFLAKCFEHYCIDVAKRNMN